MIEFEQQKNLQSLNCLAVNSTAAYFYTVNSESSLAEVVRTAIDGEMEIRVLGGGSNLILSEQLPFLVLKMQTQGIEVLADSEYFQRLAVKAGEDWHNFVQQTLAMNLSGLENLAFIPGQVGACPVQNIGAYGVEAGDYIHKVVAFDLVDEVFISFEQQQCQFGYRDSVFKQNENRYVITEVQFDLPKKFQPKLDYGPLKQLKELPQLTPKQVFEKVIEVRQEKLPEPKQLPNVGSFFKNPVVTVEQARRLKQKFPDLVAYEQAIGVKLAAGWLIDRAGLRGCSSDKSVGCFEKQALVLVNPEQASAQDVLSWAAFVAKKVYQLFEVKLEIEPRIW